MNISFKKKEGDPSLGIKFFWMMTIEAGSHAVITDHFIPELFFDFFHVQRGKVQLVNPLNGQKTSLPRQALKTIHTQPINFVFSTPLVLFGARLSLKFAEMFWEKTIEANCFLKQNWVEEETHSLTSFAFQVGRHIQARRTAKTVTHLLSNTLDESAWLRGYSARHKSRLYKSVFGISKKEMWSIQNVHSFLEQTCDFASQSPRIIRHVNPQVFYDQPHLNHAFKKITGLSPVEYFEKSSILQDNLMSASYNEIPTR